MYPHPFKRTTGRGISYFIHKPQVESRGLVILLPGYLDTKDYDHIEKLAEDLVNSGYTSVRFDPSGTWDSMNSRQGYSITNYLGDVREILDEISREQSFKNIILVGHSLGGMISLLYATGDKRISGVVAIMSPYATVRPGKEERTVEWKKQGFRTSERNLPGNKLGVEKFKVPYSFVDDSLKYNILDEIQKLKIPLLFIAGELDDVVPISDVKVIFDQANEPKKFKRLPGIDHDYRLKEKDIETVNGIVMGFILKL